MSAIKGPAPAEVPDKEVLAAVIHSHLEDDYSIDLDDAGALAEKLYRLGWRRVTDSDTALAGRVAKLERWAQGETSDWNTA